MTVIYDIETHWFGNYDVKEDYLRTISLYEIENDEWHFYTYKELDKIQAVFRRNKIIVAFNNHVYDDPILKKAGIDLRYHINLDLRVICKKRGEYIGLDKTGLSLANIAKQLKLSDFKDEEFDYKVLLKDEWTPEELAYIKEYNDQDVKVTLALYNKLVDFFTPFKEFISKADQDNMSWLKSSVAAYTYKVMCHQTGIKEEYDDSAVKKTYGGGFVAEPTCAEAHENIYCLDFASLYPHMYIMGNLASRTRKEGWGKNKFFPDLIGNYNNKEQGIMELTLFDIYNKRKWYKAQKNPLEYALKIVMNTFYGTTGNPVFKNLYNYNTAFDCTKMGQKCIKYTRDMFEAYGYEFLYTDTDSVYIKDVFKDEKKMLGVKDKIINKIKSSVPFPVDTFDMDIDYAIKHIWFFKSGDRYKKKNYMFVTEDDELVIKGLPMIKSDGSGIGIKVFDEIMRVEAIKGNVKHEYERVKDYVNKMITNNIDVVAKTFSVKKPEAYKLESQLQRQISVEYGEGKHRLIPNNTYGVGKSTKYCTLEEFGTHVRDVNKVELRQMWNELRPFIKNYPEPTRNVHVGRKRVVKNQGDLLKWTNA